jgi:hypothetical protein
LIDLTISVSNSRVSRISKYPVHCCQFSIEHRNRFGRILLTKTASDCDHLLH